MTTIIHIYCDGGAHNNQDAAKRQAYGSFKVLRNGVPITITYNGAQTDHYTAQYGGYTNNQAEYQVLIDALGYLYELSQRTDADIKVVIHSDSALMINQLSGLWKIKDMDLRDMCMVARDVINHIPFEIELKQEKRETIVHQLGH